MNPLLKTILFISKCEKVRVLGERAKQLDVGPTIIDGYIIALKESKKGKKLIVGM